MNGQYLKKPQAIIRDKRLTSVGADFLCLIAQLHNAEGCTASNRYFANYFGVDRRHAVRVISSLKAKGFIETHEKRRGGKTEARTITIIDPDSARFLLADSDNLTPSDSDNLTPSDSDKSCAGIVTTMSPKHKIIHKNTHKRAQARASVSLFDSFWKVYPKKKAKASAEKAFAKLKPDEELLNKMINAIECQKRSDDWLKDGGRFIPYPATWLNHRRWEDEIKTELSLVDVDAFGCTDEEAEQFRKAGLL